MTDSITTILKHYAGRTGTVTIANEAFDQMGHLQPNTWWETTRSDRYIFDAFRAARLADPTGAHRQRSWITDYPDSFSGYGAATPLDADYRRKRAWTGIADALT